MEQRQLRELLERVAAVPSSSLTETFPSFAATQPSCHIL